MNNNREKDINYAAFDKGEDYYEYENYDIEFEYIFIYFSNKLMQNHEIMEKIGRGKYSDVFKCINTDTGKHAVIKVLKPGNYYFNVQSEIPKLRGKLKSLRLLVG